MKYRVARVAKNGHISALTDGGAPAAPGAGEPQTGKLPGRRSDQSNSATRKRPEMPETYDLIVIGAGMAGVAAAKKCASEGWRVAIVDELPYGGTCALRGCDPKKILRRGAEIIDGARLMRSKGIDANGLCINWADLMKHKRAFTGPVPDNMERDLSGNGVETLHGTATFKGANRLEIDHHRYTAEHFLITNRCPPPRSALRRSGVPDRQHHISRPRPPAQAHSVRRWRLRLVRIRAHLGPSREQPDHHRPRDTAAQGLRFRSRSIAHQTRGRGRC